jgi:DNA-directed RNA polymerase subunit omega
VFALNVSRDFLAVLDFFDYILEERVPGGLCSSGSFCSGEWSMARITVEDCLAQVGDDNRFALVHLAVERIRQHRKGEPYLVEGKNKEVVMTLREIASGDVTFDNIKDLPARRRAKEAEERAGKTEKTAETEQE